MAAAPSNSHDLFDMPTGAASHSRFTAVFSPRRSKLRVHPRDLFECSRHSPFG
jgi:hypothetical protein